MDRKVPSAAELVVLQLLWEHGPLSVPELHEKICAAGIVGYTTVQKRLQRMEQSGLVKRHRKAGRAFTYRANYNPKTARRNVFNTALAAVFGGSANALIQHAIEEHPLSKSDIEAIRSLLDSIEGTEG